MNDIISCDVLVVGSGSAGLVAALTSAVKGLSTVIIEKSGKIGGTTAMSGAGIWIPDNHHARIAGLPDNGESALDYLRSTAPQGWQQTEDELWQRFVAEAPLMLEFVERHTPLRFALAPGPDPYPQYAGSRSTGRMLSPRPLSRRLLGPLARRLRQPPFPHIYTYQEAVASGVYRRPIRTALRHAPHLAWRLLTDQRAKGTALVTGLLRGCLDHGVRVILNAPAIDLQQDPVTGGVNGAVMRQGNSIGTIHARCGVVLATGGFEWDAGRLAIHFPGPVDFIASPRENTGDGHAMAERAGAALAHMDQANIVPAMPATYEGKPHALSLFYHREPNILVVDRNGKRFVNEHLFNLGEVLDARQDDGLPQHLPAWLISDRSFLRHSLVFRWYMRSRPDWVVRAHGLPALADRLGLPVEAVIATLMRFNAMAECGVDTDFGRQDLKPICGPHYVAVPFNRSFVSTKGGPRTNAKSQVLRPDGSAIDGLYCAGVAMANPIGSRGVGSGTTLGPNMTWGYIAGLSLADRKTQM